MKEKQPQKERNNTNIQNDEEKNGYMRKIL